MKHNFENTGRLLRLTLRRERVNSSVWVLLLSVFSIALAPGLASIFDAAAREALIQTINNPAMIGMVGPIFGIDNYTAGAMYFNMMVQWMMIAAAVMNILLVIRHTRSDEEHGRTDMLRSLPTGTFSSLSAVMLTAFLIDLAVTLLTGLGIAACAVESMDVNGALLYGAAIGTAGFVFAALAAVFSQLCSTSRGAIGLSVLSLGFLYLLRGAGDIGNEMLSYISPLGLAQRTQAFVENHWFPIVILLAEALAFTALAFVLYGHRDIRQGFIPQRRGRAAAKSYLCSPSGLAFRLLMLPFFGWIIGMFVIGASYGSILGTIDQFIESNEFYSMLIGTSPDFSAAQMFASMVTAEMSLCAVFPVLTMVMKFRSEEKDGYYLTILSGAVSKYRYLSSYAGIALLTGLLVQLAAALGIYTSAVVVLPDPDTLPLWYLLKANLVYVPALWVMLGIAVLLIGLRPRMAVAIWGYFGFSFFVTFLGRLPDFLPEWVVKLTPFGWIPNLPTDEISIPTLVLLTGIAIVLILGGLAAYRRRDVSAA